MDPHPPKRYRHGGLQALEPPQSKRPHTNPPRATPPTQIVKRILELRQELTDTGQDNGAHTIRWHLEKEGTEVPPRVLFLGICLISIISCGGICFQKVKSASVVRALTRIHMLFSSYAAPPLQALVAFIHTATDSHGRPIL